MKNIFYLSAVLFVVIFSSCGPTSVIVKQRPVAPVYARPISPGVGYVWVEGTWVGNRRTGYTYRNGYYVKPSRGRYHYKPGYWVKHRNGYYWKNGRW